VVLLGESINQHWYRVSLHAVRSRIRARVRKLFSTPFQSEFLSTGPPIHSVPYKATHPLPSSADVKEEVELFLYSVCEFTAVTKQKLPLFCSTYCFLCIHSSFLHSISFSFLSFGFSLKCKHHSTYVDYIFESFISQKSLSTNKCYYFLFSQNS